MVKETMNSSQLSISTNVKTLNLHLKKAIYRSKKDSKNIIENVQKALKDVVGNT